MLPEGVVFSYKMKISFGHFHLCFNLKKQTCHNFKTVYRNLLAHGYMFLIVVHLKQHRPPQKFVTTVGDRVSVLNVEVKDLCSRNYQMAVLRRQDWPPRIWPLDTQPGTSFSLGVTLSSFTPFDNCLEFIISPTNRLIYQSIFAIHPRN